jgi:hypothetical protein
MSDQESGEHDRGRHLNLALTPVDSATPNDENDMTRLGKTQEFKVSIRGTVNHGDFRLLTLSSWAEKLQVSVRVGIYMYAYGNMGIHSSVSVPPEAFGNII